MSEEAKKEITVILINKCCSGGKEHWKVARDLLQRHGLRAVQQVIHVGSNPEAAKDLGIERRAVRRHGPWLVIPELDMKFPCSKVAFTPEAVAQEIAERLADPGDHPLPGDVYGGA